MAASTYLPGSTEPPTQVCQVRERSCDSRGWGLLDLDMCRDRLLFPEVSQVAQVWGLFGLRAIPVPPSISLILPTAPILV